MEIVRADASRHAGAAFMLIASFGWPERAEAPITQVGVTIPRAKESMECIGASGYQLTECGSDANRRRLRR